MRDLTFPKDIYQRPLRDLRISVIDRCNFRCPYCMPQSAAPAFLPSKAWLSFEQISRFVGVAASLGVKKVRLTGGEPLLRPKLHGLVESIRRIPAITDLALTTNGYLLSRQARTLRESGLMRLTVSLDSLDPQTFADMSGGHADIRQVLAGIEEAQRVGFGPIKINMVVQRGKNDHQVVDMVRHFQHTGHIVRFIEYMDVGTRNAWNPADVVSGQEILENLNQVFAFKPITTAEPGQVARYYQHSASKSVIGIITSISEPFCSTCTRLRLSADGKLYTCLFAQTGHPIRQFLEDSGRDDALRSVLEAIWKSRDDAYSELRLRKDSSSLNPQRVEMYQIGG